MNCLDDKKPTILLHAEGLEVLYDISHDTTRQALSNINLVLYEGERLSIVGPSGCGKTSLLNVFNGFIVPNHGQALFHGHPILGPNVLIGRIFQESTLFPWRTVIGNIISGTRMRGLGRQEREAELKSILQECHISDCCDLYPSELSGGMAQRVEIARAMSNRPEVLLADEPFSNLDYLTRGIVRKWFVSALEKWRISVMLVTHDIEEALFFGDRVAIMSASPGSISKIIDVPFPRPRQERLTQSGEFVSLVGNVEALLRRSDA